MLLLHFALWLVLRKHKKEQILKHRLRMVAYHHHCNIFDLDAYRELDWLFCKDKNDPEYIRKVLNRKDLNRGLRELIVFHGLKFPN